MDKALAQKKEALRTRGLLMQSVRSFFYTQGYIEIDTPVRIPRPALEDYIDAEPSADWYLRTSPELHMKRLICAGYDKIFQIGSCFRQKEFGERHRPEFTMLEWYRIDTDYRGILDEMIRLCRSASKSLALREEYFAADWEVLTVDEAFHKYAGESVFDSIEKDEFELTLCDKVEPHLGFDRPTVLIDYPSSMAALSRKKQDDPRFAERWELYVEGIEIANAYSELTDAEEQELRFKECAELRSNDGREAYDIDQPFIDALKSGLPECGGIAVGMDRLAMIFAGTKEISDVVAFDDESVEI